jgi:hypothetical protein
MLYLIFLCVVKGTFLWQGKKTVEDLRALFFVSFCLFRLVDGSGGCAIAIVALATINEDQDHFSYPSSPDPPPSPNPKPKNPE